MTIQLTRLAHVACYACCLSSPIVAINHGAALLTPAPARPPAPPRADAQPWDIEGERAQPLPDPSAPDGMKRTKDGGRVLYDAKGSTCATCGNMIMCNPLSAVCIYCDSQLDNFR